MTEAEVELVERALFQLDEARQELARQRMELEECITGLQDIQALLTRPWHTRCQTLSVSSGGTHGLGESSSPRPVLLLTVGFQTRVLPAESSGRAPLFAWHRCRV